MTKCIHCLRALKKATKDHVFPRSWYPNNTPSNVQRWTVPSCPECNGKFGKMEKEVFVRLALCIDPEKAEASGISRKALEALGVGVSASKKEREHREALRRRILNKRFRIPVDFEPFPGLGPHQGFPVEMQSAIPIPADKLLEVAKKVLRGCEYVLGDKRVIEPPHVLEVYFAHEEKISDVTQLFQRIGQVHLGPSFQVQRAIGRDDRKMVLYKVVVFGTLTMYGSIADPSTLPKSEEKNLK